MVYPQVSMIFAPLLSTKLIFALYYAIVSVIVSTIFEVEFPHIKPQDVAPPCSSLLVLAGLSAVENP